MGVDRVILGKRGSDYGLFISKASKNVKTCSTRDLLFYTPSSRGGTVYAGGQVSAQSDTTSLNFLTTNSKDNLGYIPLVIWNEDLRGEGEITSSGGCDAENVYGSRIDVIETTSSTIHPCGPNWNNPGWGYTYTYGDGFQRNRNVGNNDGSSADFDMTNLSYLVIRMPCAPGYMTNSFFWS